MKNAFVLDEGSLLVGAIGALDKGGIGFLAITDAAGVLLGILTDGDIRRAFLQKINDLNLLINKKPEVMLAGTPAREIIARMKRLHLRHMPLVSHSGVYAGVFSFDEDVEFISRKNPVVIMAGGLGSRLGELTMKTPKPMLTVGNQPILQHLISVFSEQGFRRFILCVNYKKDVIKDYFKNGEQFGVSIEYVEEKEKLGTAGAISLITSEIVTPFFVINADILVNMNFVDLLECHKKSNSVATMCVMSHRHQVPYGVVDSGADLEIKKMTEKPEYVCDVNAGIYLLSPKAIEHIPKGVFFDMPSLFECLIKKGCKASVFHLDDYWLDIGRKEDLQKANADMHGYTLL